MEKKLIQPVAINWMIGVSALILFTCSSVKHILFQSTAFDLGIFDQAVYLISQGKPPISSYLGYHILGDHAAWIFYPLSLLYKIYPSVYWLFAVQAIALVLGALPTWYLAIQAGLKQNQAIAMALVYLLYPLVFNINLFDFHPDIIAVPAFLWSVLAARGGKIWWFCVSIVLVLGCKAVLSLTVVGMGVWLLFFEKRRLYGAIAIISGIAWFLIATKGIIPFFGTAAASIERHLGRYSYLGSSFPEVAKNLLLNPGIILTHLFSADNLFYLILLIAPVIWGLSLHGLKPLVAVIPCLAINLLADDNAQKDLIHQYSLPILPFLILAVISNLATGKALLGSKRAIILWSLVAFLSLAKFTHFGGKFLNSLDTWQATREAITLVKTKGSVYTTGEISPHLSHRKFIKHINPNLKISNLLTIDYILLNIRHPGLSSNQEFDVSLLTQLKNQPEFKLEYERDDVYLFVKK